MPYRMYRIKHFFSFDIFKFFELVLLLTTFYWIFEYFVILLHKNFLKKTLKKLIVYHLFFNFRKIYLVWSEVIYFVFQKIICDIIYRHKYGYGKNIDQFEYYNWFILNVREIKKFRIRFYLFKNFEFGCFTYSNLTLLSFQV